MPHAAVATDPATADVEERVRIGIPLVHYAVHDLVARVPRHITHDDLLGAGMLGLAQAARSWDPDRGVTFERYARTRIRGALLDELRGRDWATRSVRAKARHLQASVESHTQRTGRAPSSTELAADLGLSAGELARMESDVHRTTVLQFDAIFADPDATPLPAADGDEPADALLRRELLGYLGDAVTCLPERLRTVVVEYFFEERQMQDIAADLGVTESRVSQLRAEAVALLREGLDRLLEPAPAEATALAARRTRRTAAYLAEVAAASDLRTRLATPAGDRPAAQAISA